MRRYEAMRETFNGCAGRWQLDDTFTREMETEDVAEALQDWYRGPLPPHRWETRDDGTILCTFDPPCRERYHFSPF